MNDDPERLKQENKDLRDALANARESMQSFVYVVSHDLGAPLRAMTGFSDILKERYANKLDDKGRSYMAFIHEGAAKAQAMLQGLLIYARVYSQGGEAKRVSLNALLGRALESCSTKSAEAQLTTDVSPLPECLCDPNQIERLFAILLDNALTYRIPNVPVKVAVEAKETDTHWIVTVTDNGIGFPPEAASRIFQIFKRLHTDEAYPGLGVGLAIAARIVERHRGTISAREGKPNGAVFTFTLGKEGPEQFISPLEEK